MKNRGKLLLCWAAFLLSGCGESYSEVSARHKEALDSLQADLAKLAEVIPDTLQSKELEAPLDPAPSFKEDDEASNTDIQIWDRLNDPDKEFRHGEIMDLYLSNGVSNYFTFSNSDEKAPKDYDEKLKQVGDLRYLVGYRIYKYIAPEVEGTADPLKYTIGNAIAGVYVFDRKAGEIVCSFPVTAASDQKVEFKPQNNESRAAAGQRWARSSLWTNLRKQTLMALQENVGGSFELRN